MHAAAKVMFALGGVICVIGIFLFAAGADAAEIDVEEEAIWSGTSGNWDYDDEDIYLVYVKSGTSCDGFSATMTDENGSTGNWLEDNIDIDECAEWDEDDLDGYILIGSIGLTTDAGTYTMEASDKIYIIGAGEELGEAIGGGLAILGSWGILCCGGFFLLLGTIFALTLKKGEAQVVVVNQHPQAMAAQGGQQVVYQEQVVQQPPQGGI